MPLEEFGGRAAVVDALARLNCMTSRTFGVCLACPHGSHVDGYGTSATAWYDSPEFGRYGLCETHDEEWARRAREEVR